MRTISPCKDCTDRYVGCHADCEKYLAWKAEWNEYKKGKPDNGITFNHANVRKSWQNMRYQRQSGRWHRDKT